MSSSDREFRPVRAVRSTGRLAGIAFAVVFLGLAGACTVRPVYMPVANSPKVYADLSAIAINGVADRVAQEVRNNLIVAFTGGRAPPPAIYTLSMTVDTSEERLGFERDDTAPAYQVTVSVRYELTEIASGRSIVRTIGRGVASYDRSNQNFANVRARLDAENRAALAAAEEIQLRLALELANKKAS
ncbi:LPS assembly lipoprotein LptE [Kaistia dalseonensis]|uniref:LPS-assembly lipoprotein n=1 Tax=Kaistia dalseonensis TaxID=410840 RepID=A0ABU0H5S8_9HYPH|nr:LPS assembly lipoprotein LptE [Kaistia dalseonensis]MCX5494801.1 LPS assembly lipoprotein LptE [Kaistia dalseonensis]MDQ0437382.1 LPS-assembly lipoprotein [Kaistia dalseonensis]